MRKYMVFLSKFFMKLGIIFAISPVFLYCFIHGNYDRYIWIINGPFPFNSFGGGPFQLLMYGGLCVSGIVLITVSLIFKRRIND